MKSLLAALVLMVLVLGTVSVHASNGCVNKGTPVAVGKHYSSHRDLGWHGYITLLDKDGNMVSADGHWRVVDNAGNALTDWKYIDCKDFQLFTIGSGETLLGIVYFLTDAAIKQRLARPALPEYDGVHGEWYGSGVQCLGFPIPNSYYEQNKFFYKCEVRP